MPGRDRSGPMGMGPQTGRGRGYCAGSAAPGYVEGPGWGRGMGWGGGRGRGGRCWGGGRGFGFRGGWGSGDAWGPAPIQRMAPSDEMSVLRSQAEALGGELKAIQDRISALEAGNKEEQPEK